MAAARIFVGTLASGEAEFEECCDAIGGQEGVAVTHHVISGLRELEAHNALWAAWERVKDEHDLMVKVDADTVLARPTALGEIYALFENPEVTGAQILLHDYFTDRLIAGLNAFSPAVVFKPAASRLFADHADSGHKVVLKGEPVAHLAPIGWHCTRPHARQAFHFGLHRALKRQREVIRRVAAVWLKERDEARFWALAGARAARWWMRFNTDYGGRQLQAAFAKIEADPRRIDRIDHYAKSLTLSLEPSR